MASRDKATPDATAGTRGKPTTGQGVWSGDAVAHAPEGQAEDQALRAQGKAPISMKDAGDRDRSDIDKGSKKAPAVKRQSAADAEASQRLKQEAAAEEHRKVQAERGVGPHGKL